MAIVPISRKWPKSSRRLSDGYTGITATTAVVLEEHAPARRADMYDWNLLAEILSSKSQVYNKGCVDYYHADMIGAHSPLHRSPINSYLVGLIQITVAAIIDGDPCFNLDTLIHRYRELECLLVRETKRIVNRKVCIDPSIAATVNRQVG